RTSRVCSFSAVSAEEAKGLATMRSSRAVKGLTTISLEASVHEHQSEAVADPGLGPGSARELRQHGVEHLQLLRREDRGPRGLPLVVDPQRRLEPARACLAEREHHSAAIPLVGPAFEE